MERAHLILSTDSSEPMFLARRGGFELIGPYYFVVLGVMAATYFLVLRHLKRRDVQSHQQRKADSDG